MNSRRESDGRSPKGVTIQMETDPSTQNNGTPKNFVTFKRATYPQNQQRFNPKQESSTHVFEPASENPRKLDTEIREIRPKNAYKKTHMGPRKNPGSWRALAPAPYGELIQHSSLSSTDSLNGRHTSTILVSPIKGYLDDYILHNRNRLFNSKCFCTLSGQNKPAPCREPNYNHRNGRHFGVWYVK